MPAQYVFEPQRNQNEDLDQLMTGLVQNVAYRRAQQARKFATAQDMATKMATGLIPKANITVTDEGYEFGDEGSLGQEIAGTGLQHGKQRKAFYEAVGGMMGNESMDREGGTDTTAKMIKDETAWDQQRQEARADRLQTPGLADAEQNYKAASSYLQNTILPRGATPKPSNPPGPSPILQPPASGSTVNPAAQAAIQAALGLPPSMAQTIASGGQAPTPSNLVQSIVGPSGKIATSQNEMVADNIDVSVNTPSISTSRSQQAEFSTTKQSARIDAIKTSYMNLMGLSALEGYDNQQMRVGDLNNGAPENNTFQNIAKQRLADIARWELAALGDGTEQDIKEVGKRTYEVGASTQSVKAARKDSVANRQSISNGDGRGGDTKAAQYKLGNLNLELGRDLSQRGSDYYVHNASLKLEDIDDKYTVRKADGKVYVNFESVFNQIKDTSTGADLPDIEKDLLIEIAPDKFYSPLKQQWYKDKNRQQQTEAPAAINTTYAKVYNKAGEQALYIDGGNVSISNASVRLAGLVSKGKDNNGWKR